MKKLLLILLVLSANAAFAQRTVSGLITDKNNQAIVGVTVCIKNCNTKAITDFDGKYSIVVPENCKTLEFSKEGFKVQVVDITGDVVNLTMNKITETDIFELSLEELMNVEVVTATKSSQSAAKAPATILVVTEEQIAARGYTSLMDVFLDLPDVKAENYYGSGNVALRGIMGMQYFQILIDGMRISSPTNEWLPIMEDYPVNLAKQIEIVYGPASALYGADAVSGVINIITRKPDKESLMVDVSTSYGSYGKTNNTFFIGKKFKENASLVFSAQYFYDETPPLDKFFRNDTLLNLSGLQTGTFNSAWGPMTPKDKVANEYGTPMQAYNIFACLRVSDFSFSIFKNYSEYNTSWGYVPTNAVYNKDVIWGQSITTVNAGYTKNFGKVKSYSTVSGSRYDLTPESRFRNIFVSLENGYKYSFSNEIKAEQQIDWTISDKINLIGGATFESFTSLPKTADLEDKVDESKNLRGVMIGTRAYYNPGGIKDEFNILKYNNTGVYAQAAITPTEQISLTLGARFDHSSNYGSTFNPRFGVVYTPTSRTTIKALYGSAFLAPRPFDAYEHYGSFYTLDSGKTYKSGYWHLPNPELEPIYEKTFELGLKQFIGSNLSLSITGYYTKLTNLYAYIADADYKNFYNGTYLGYKVDYIDVLYNQGEQKLYGGSLQIDHSLKFAGGRLNSFVSISYVDGAIQQKYQDANKVEQTTDAEIPAIAPFTLRFGTDFTYKRFSLAPRIIVTSEQHAYGFVKADIPNKRQTHKGYTLVNLSARYKVLDKLSVFLNITNLTNADYRMPTGGNPEDVNPLSFRGAAGFPIRIVGGLQLKF